MTKSVADLAGHDVVCVDRRATGFDAGEPDCLSALENIAPVDIAINCIVQKVPGESALGIDRFFRVNSLFPRRLASWCHNIGARMVYVSTDAVFPGREEPYSELDVPDPDGLYGLSKILGEVEQRHVINVRCSIVGPEKDCARNLMQWLLNHDDGEQVPGFTNHIWHGVTSLQLARWCCSLAEPEVFEAFRSRSHVFHFVPNAPISKYQLLEEIVRAYRRNIRVVPALADKPRHRTLRSLYSEALGFSDSGLPMVEAINQLVSSETSKG